jgi:pectate lyase
MIDSSIRFSCICLCGLTSICILLFAVGASHFAGPRSCPGFVIEGFGKETVGGCGGTVYTVTNLNDSGPGSLRDVINRRGPRIIRFAVSGSIVLRNFLNVDQPFVTIDGSDAPNGGVALTGHTLGTDTDNVIIRHLRFRPGVQAKNDSLQLFGSNIFVDHCSLSWAGDENLDIYSRNVTIQWSIISENIGSGAVLIYYRNPSVTLHHNLFAHNPGARHPEIGIGDLDFVNNVIYNYAVGSTNVHPGCAINSCEFQEGGPVKANIVGNYYQSGPNSTVPPAYSREVRLRGGRRYSAQSSVFVTGNIRANRPKDTQPEHDVVWQDDGGMPIQSSRHNFPSVTTTSAIQAYRDVLEKAGARLPCLDAVDRRIITDIRHGTGRVIKDPSEVGGWPDLTKPCDSGNRESKERSRNTRKMRKTRNYSGYFRDFRQFRVFRDLSNFEFASGTSGLSGVIPPHYIGSAFPVYPLPSTVHDLSQSRADIVNLILGHDTREWQR